MDTRAALIGGGVQAGQVAMGAPDTGAGGDDTRTDPVADERLRVVASMPGLVTEISDDDYRCVWRPCPALEEQPPEDNP